MKVALLQIRCLKPHHSSPRTSLQQSFLHQCPIVSREDLEFQLIIMFTWRDYLLTLFLECIPEGLGWLINITLPIYTFKWHNRCCLLLGLLCICWHEILDWFERFNLIISYGYVRVTIYDWLKWFLFHLVLPTFEKLTKVLFQNTFILGFRLIVLFMGCYCSLFILT